MRKNEGTKQELILMYNAIITKHLCQAKAHSWNTETNAIKIMSLNDSIRVKVSSALFHDLNWAFEIYRESDRMLKHLLIDNEFDLG